MNSLQSFVINIYLIKCWDNIFWNVCWKNGHNTDLTRNNNLFITSSRDLHATWVELDNADKNIITFYDRLRRENLSLNLGNFNLLIGFK